MKRFKIEYSINGEQVELYAEPMDMHHRMYSLERQLMDPHPLLIEHTNSGWVVKSQDNWMLSPEEVNNLGELLEREYPNRPQE
ncbi:hypothetical protein [Pedobacter sp. SYSU D00535]|uniref:hypothetical protein n=1 Tax=Pedobacter sp. SYSU D00535 TaxID=2810308 RepID=UPI001A961BA5|nr:hypothetical protein [Pedobacter sp. SYSU D00535]